MGPFDTAMVEPPGGRSRFVVDLRARICTCQEFQIRNLACSHALVTIDVAGKQLADYIPHHHMLTCWRDTYKYNVRPIAFEIPKYQPKLESQAPINDQLTDVQLTASDGQPTKPPGPAARLRVPTVHEVRPTPPEMALTVDNFHPPTGQFAAVIGNRKTARFEKGRHGHGQQGRRNSVVQVVEV